MSGASIGPAVDAVLEAFCWGMAFAIAVVIFLPLSLIVCYLAGIPLIWANAMMIATIPVSKFVLWRLGNI